MLYADNLELSIGDAEIGKSMDEIDEALGSGADQSSELDENGSMYHIYRNGKIGVTV